MTPKLMYASTKNADMFYVVKTTICDPFFFLEIGERKLVFLDQREYEAFKEYDYDQKFEVVPLEPLIEKARKSKDFSGIGQLALVIIQTYIPDAKEIEVPTHFPLHIADFLRAQGISGSVAKCHSYCNLCFLATIDSKLPDKPQSLLIDSSSKIRDFVTKAHSAPDPLKVRNNFFPERAVKTKTEIFAIQQALNKTTLAFKRIEEILIEAVIKDGYIIFEDKILTSELVKKEVEQIFFQNNMFNAEGLIISSGQQTAIPHHSGSGPILPNEPIICDIFPQDRSTGYFADMTRTYVKGQAKQEMKNIYQAVLKAQMAGIEAIKPGVTGKFIDNICCESLIASGYETRENEGFIHSTGHGLGLDVHELPNISRGNNEVLVPGNVVTIEPGLYYKDRGSVRIEDVILVTQGGFRNLTNYPKVLEIA